MGNCESHTYLNWDFSFVANCFNSNFDCYCRKKIRISHIGYQLWAVLVQNKVLWNKVAIIEFTCNSHWKPTVFVNFVNKDWWNAQIELRLNFGFQCPFLAIQSFSINILFLRTCRAVNFCYILWRHAHFTSAFVSSLMISVNCVTYMAFFTLIGEAIFLFNGVNFLYFRDLPRSRCDL